MSARTSTENKALAPVTENKAAEPVEAVALIEDTTGKDGKVAVIFAHPVDAGRLDEDEHKVGSRLRVKPTVATRLLQQGVARLA